MLYVSSCATSEPTSAQTCASRGAVEFGCARSTPPWPRRRSCILTLCRAEFAGRYSTSSLERRRHQHRRADQVAHQKAVRCVVGHPPRWMGGQLKVQHPRHLHLRNRRRLPGHHQRHRHRRRRRKKLHQRSNKKGFTRGSTGRRMTT